MVLRKNLVRSMVVAVIYLVVTLCLFFAADRVERMDKEISNGSRTTILNVEK